jgi:hypothetical protein
LPTLIAGALPVIGIICMNVHKSAKTKLLSKQIDLEQLQWMKTKAIEEIHFDVKSSNLDNFEHIH